MHSHGRNEGANQYSTYSVLNVGHGSWRQHQGANRSREGSGGKEKGGRWKRKDKQGGHRLLAWETRTGMEEQGAGVEIDLTTDVCENPP